MTEQRFDFLQELVKNIPDISVTEEAVNYNEDEIESSPERQNYPDSDTPYDLTMSSTSTRLIRDVINGNFQKFKNSHTYAENNCNIKIGSSEAAINTNTIYDKDLHAQIERHSKPLRHESVMAQCCPTPTPFAAKSAKTQAMRSQDILEAEIAKLSETETQSFEEEGHEHLKTEVALRKHRRQRKSHNIPKPTPSVIRHTTSLLNTDHAPYPPVKLYCTNSAPAVSVGDWLLPLQHLTESRSVPCDMKAVFPLIPGPFVSIDFCNKPVVKIDYSNLCLPNQVPTSGKGNARGFNFNAEPIINIDLSNIVTSSGNDLNVTPMPTFFNPLAQSNIIEESMAQGNSNSSIASAMEHSSSAVTSAIASSSSAVRQHDSLLELDEDYDNI